MQILLDVLTVMMVVAPCSYLRWRGLQDLCPSSEGLDEFAVNEPANAVRTPELSLFAFEGGSFVNSDDFVVLGENGRSAETGLGWQQVLYLLHVLANRDCRLSLIPPVPVKMVPLTPLNAVVPHRSVPAHLDAFLVVLKIVEQLKVAVWGVGLC